MHGGIKAVASSEKRKYQRLPIGLDLSCRKIGSAQEKCHTGRTINASPGGLYFQTPTGEFKPGNLLSVELSIPPTTGLLEYGGRISGLARVLRADDIRQLQADVSLSSGRYGVALEFCHPPRLST